MNLDEDALNIFTDGSSYSNPRKGGTGIRFVTINTHGLEEIEDFPTMGYAGATNNQMELQATIQALKISIDNMNLGLFKKIIIYTDSSYVVENFSIARFQWSQNKWNKSCGAPVLNAEQWKELIKTTNKIYEIQKIKVEFKWVKGHAKNEHNKVVDKLAKQSAKANNTMKISNLRVRRKKFKDVKVVVGSVKMLGQRINIYIVTDEYLKLPDIFKYKYQVISKSNLFYKCTDIIYSKEMLSSGHSYSVRFNDDNNNPQIVKMFNEIEKKLE